MCFSGFCIYEDYMGDCSVGTGIRDKCLSRYGFLPCIFGKYDAYLAGNIVDEPSVMQFMDEHEHDIRALRKDFYNRKSNGDWDSAPDIDWDPVLHSRKYLRGDR